MFSNSLKSFYLVLLILPHHLLGDPNTVIGLVTDGSLTINGPYAMAISPNSQKMYIANYNNSTVSIVNVATNTVTGLVTDSSHALNGPYGTVFSPDGTTAYVMNYDNSTITIINVATDTVTGTINQTAVAISTPAFMVITPDGTRGYVANSGGGFVTQVNLLSNATIQNITVGSEALGNIVITPDGTKAFISDFDTHVYALNLATLIVSPVAGTFNYPFGLAITPDGSTLYVANFNTNNVSIVNVATNSQTGTVTDLSPSTFDGPFWINVSPDGLTLYVGNDSASTVSMVNTATNSVMGIVNDPGATINNPLVQMITPSSAIGYIANNNNTISVMVSNVPSPVNVTGCKSQDIFLLQKDLIDILSWSSPTAGTGPVSYKIFSNTGGSMHLAGTVSASAPLKFIDNNRVPNVNYNYCIVSIDSQNNSSSPACVTVNPNC